MNIVCLDLEGVLVPEIWIAFSEASGIPDASIQPSAARNILRARPIRS